MNKKLISRVVITVLFVVVVYLLVREIQTLRGDIDGLNDEIQIMTDEKRDLIIENEELQVDEELSKLIEELEACQKISANSLKFAEESEQKFNELVEASKKGSYPDEASIYMLKDMGIEDYSILTDSLSELGQDIIGFEGILGGTMHFVNVTLLNDRWAFGRFEDGHYGGYGIYSFEINEEEIVWNIVVEYSDN